MTVPLVTEVQPTFDAINEMFLRMKQEFDKQDREGEDQPGLVRMIDDPDALAESSAEFCLARMREAGAFRPWIMLMSRRCVQCFLLAGQMPHDPLQQIMIATSFRVLLASTSVGAYWIAGEIWFADGSRDPGVSRLRASQREDRREGLIVVTATASSYRVSVYETVRGGDGAVTDLREVDLPPDALRLDDPIMRNLFEGREKFQSAMDAFGGLS